MDFNIFNFSSVTIHFILKCRRSKAFEILEDPEKDIELIPNFGTIEPGNSMNVKIVLTPRQKGFYEITIDYLHTSQRLNLLAISGLKPYSICKLICDCCLPTLQVK